MTPNMPGSGPSNLPQTNQGTQKKTAAQFHYEMPPWPQILYITPLQKDQILMILRSQGLVADNAEVVQDGYNLGLPNKLGDGNFYSLYWIERVVDASGTGFDIPRTDQLGHTYNLYMDRAVAAQRVDNPPPVMVRRGDDGSFGFK